MAAQKFAGKNILIVDDEPALREILREEFEYEGASVSEAPNGRQALEHLKQSPCDLVVSDIRMPGGDGVGLLKGINSDKLNIPVFLFMSGFSDLSIDEAYDLGAAAILAKPFDISAIMSHAERNLLPIEERFKDESPPKAQVSISKSGLESLEKALQDGEISLGRAGIFVRGSGFGSGTTCHFKITFKEGDIANLEGDGLVRWNRNESHTDFPPGVGIEFSSLPHETREKIVSLIRSHKYTQFIPRK